MKTLKAILTLGTALFASSTHSASAQEYELKLSSMLPAVTTHHKQVLVPWVEMLEEKSGGRLKIALFPGSSLCKPTEQYGCVEAGLADIAYGIPGWSPGRFPRTSVAELPFLFKSAETGSSLLAELWDDYVSKDYPRVQVLAMNTQPAGHISTKTKPVGKMEDLKGLQIRTPTAVVGEMVQALGAQQVGMASSEIYQAMQLGTLDGLVLNYEGLLAFKLDEVTKYHTEVSAYSTTFALFMNKKSLSGLPEDLQALILESTSPASGYWAEIGAKWDGNDQNARSALVEKGHEIITLSAEERARWQEKTAAIYDEWVKSAEERGVDDAAALLDAARGIVAESGEHK
ncbi:hypothetical protein GN330_03110 [Nitratireductor sp. CAU 1489]|uniref:TRAP-type C4-dicarboxylate transport system, substrate-binding protein n=1 Tax=Nitratireductor arenosus TaxID=2682096 RepID=A0A844QEK0_9HYPH|nr:TRAP transporter substrate-binding protein [Nitratireductor arenosus]MVA96239.1 hypothetical protein [Nitratireductor arenosus]